MGRFLDRGVTATRGSVELDGLGGVLPMGQLALAAAQSSITVHQYLQSCVNLTHNPTPGRRRALLYRGLRVRVGIHSGACACLWWPQGTCHGAAQPVPRIGAAAALCMCNSPVH